MTGREGKSRVRGCKAGIGRTVCTGVILERTVWPSGGVAVISAPLSMAEDRKTPEQRAQMSDIERLRHSCAHVLATAILRIWPEAQFAAGPPVENGFYYDVELSHRISPDDFEKIEGEMKREVKANNVFERIEVSRDQALKDAKGGRLAALSERNQPSKFKLDIVQGIPEGEGGRLPGHPPPWVLLSRRRVSVARR